MMVQHYYSEEQESELRLRKIKALLKGQVFNFYVGAGVFSGKKIDKGTTILIENAIIKNNSKVLDFGCGYGAVGIAIAKTFSGTKVLMTDINRRAVKLARMNVKFNMISADVVQGNLYEKIKGKFNTILVNPPQTAGKKICFEIIEKSKDFLEKNGLLQLVARHNKGGKVLEEKMKEIFGNVKEIVKKAGYRVYVSKK